MEEQEFVLSERATVSGFFLYFILWVLLENVMLCDLWRSVFYIFHSLLYIVVHSSPLQLHCVFKRIFYDIDRSIHRISLWWIVWVCNIREYILQFRRKICKIRKRSENKFTIRFYANFPKFPKNVAGEIFLEILNSQRYRYIDLM